MSLELETPSAGASADPAAGAQAAALAATRPDARILARRFAFVIALIVLDLWSKSAVFAWMEGLDRAGELVPDECGFAHMRRPVVDGWFTFMLSLNPGAAFGKLDGWPWLLVGGRIFASLFLIWLIVRTGRNRPWLVTAFVLVLAGALGNLYDNLLRTRDLALDRLYVDRPFGPVRDFVDVYFDVWKYHFPTFNVADSCITVGAILLLLTSLKRESHAPSGG